MSKTLNWHFPLPRPHTGAKLGNGKQGVLVWGESSVHLTVARAGFWDHRGGVGLLTGTTYAAVRQALEADDGEALEQLFPPRKAGTPHPQQMGGGRLELTFAQGHPLQATLDLASAELRLTLGSDEDSPMAEVCLYQHPDAEVLWLEAKPEVLAGLQVRLLAAYDVMAAGVPQPNPMQALGIAPAQKWDRGFVQHLPADDGLCVAYKLETGRLALATALGSEARTQAEATLANFDADEAHRRRREFWSGYWARSARVTLPDPLLQRQFDYGLFQQAGILRLGAPAGTLQGPWMEDTRIPPWSNDYHFNINVQLVYGAAAVTGHAADMQPLWDLLKGWLPKLRAMGEGFHKRQGALLLPHAVDDRLGQMGTFWAGVLDQACIAWTAHVAWQTWRVSGDQALLADVVWPLLTGSFEGYWAMLDDFSLPISVSPEFGGSDRRQCWGRNASFQLAALHRTVADLRVAATALGHAPDPRWDEVEAQVPRYTLVDASDGSYGWIPGKPERIALWEGKDLPESHRHHSHLAAIYPFTTIDPFAPEHQGVLMRSINRWNTMGAGNWTGWCLPWASALCSRLGLPDAALGWLQVLGQQYTNEGYATLHNADGAGFGAWDDGSLAWPNHRKGPDFLYHEIMQMDATMGAITAVLELLVSVRGDTITVTDRLPKGWREVSVERVRVEGGFEVSAQFRHGKVWSITVFSTRGGPLQLAHALGDRWLLGSEVQTGTLLKAATRAGQTLKLERFQ